ARGHEYERLADQIARRVGALNETDAARLSPVSQLRRHRWTDDSEPRAGLEQAGHLTLRDRPGPHDEAGATAHLAAGPVLAPQPSATICPRPVAGASTPAARGARVRYVRWSARPVKSAPPTMFPIVTGIWFQSHQSHAPTSAPSIIPAGMTNMLTTECSKPW